MQDLLEAQFFKDRIEWPLIQLFVLVVIKVFNQIRPGIRMNILKVLLHFPKISSVPFNHLISLNNFISEGIARLNLHCSIIGLHLLITLNNKLLHPINHYD